MAGKRKRYGGLRVPGPWPETPRRLSIGPAEAKTDYGATSSAAPEALALSPERNAASLNAGGNLRQMANFTLQPSPRRDANGEPEDGRLELRHDYHWPEEVLKRRYAEWQERHVEWQNGFGNGWVPDGVVGRGGNGLAGLWRRVGTSGAEREGAVDAVVVKQSRARHGGLKREGEVMKILNDTGSRHFPKLYKRVYRDRGTGVEDLMIDRKDTEVHRMFVEYCPGGDVNGLIKDLVKAQVFLSEDRIWSIFRCLVKALWVMEAGSEDPALPGWSRPGFVHFDIKPGNILIGTEDATEHVVERIFKTNDFGLTEDAIPIAKQTPKYVDSLKHHGTTVFLAPEQQVFGWHEDPLAQGRILRIRELPAEQRYYGSHTNVYQIGATMWCLMMRERSFPSDSELYRSQLSPQLRRGLTIGRRLESVSGPTDGDGYEPNNDVSMHDEEANQMPMPQQEAREADMEWEKSPSTYTPPQTRGHYSNNLKSLVLECLMQNYRLRPHLYDLMKRCKDGVTISNAATSLASLSQTPTPLPSAAQNNPTNPDPLSAQWRSAEPINYWNELRLPTVQRQIELSHAERQRWRAKVHAARKKLRKEARDKNLPGEMASMRARRAREAQDGIFEVVSEQFPDGERRKKLKTNWGQPNWSAGQGQKDLARALAGSGPGEEWTKIDLEDPDPFEMVAPRNQDEAAEAPAEGGAVDLVVLVYRLGADSVGDLEVEKLRLPKTRLSLRVGELRHVLRREHGVEFSWSNMRLQVLGARQRGLMPNAMFDLNEFLTLGDCGLGVGVEDTLECHQRYRVRIVDGEEVG